jgi:hypothetical protein
MNEALSDSQIFTGEGNLSRLDFDAGRSDPGCTKRCKRVQQNRKWRKVFPAIYNLHILIDTFRYTLLESA